MEKILKKRYSNAVSDELQVAKQELNDLLWRRAEFIIHKTRQNLIIVMAANPADS